MKEFKECLFDVISLEADIITTSNFNGSEGDVVKTPGDSIGGIFDTNQGSSNE